MAPRRSLGELFFELRARTEGLKADTAVAEKQLGKLTTFVLKNPVAAFAALGAAMIGVVAKAAAMAAGVETSMRRIGNVTAGGAEGLQQLQATIANLARETGRSQIELAQAAEQAAKSSENTVETGARLRAALQVSQATGEELTGILAGLDQALDLFNISGTESASVLAELFTVSKGKQPLSDLFGELQAAAPAIQQLNLDLPTAARALVALGESGLNAKQAGSALKALATNGAEGRAEIVRLASTIPTAVDPMRALAEAARNVNESAANAGNVIRETLNAELIALGNTVLPGVVAGLRQFNRLIDQIRGGGGSASGTQNNIVTILADFEKAFSVLPDQQGQLKSLKRAVLEVVDGVEDGRVVLSDLDVNTLKPLADRFLALSQARVFTDEQRKAIAKTRDEIVRTIQAIETAQSTPGRGKATPAITLGSDAQEKAAEELKKIAEATADFLDAQDNRTALANDRLKAALENRQNIQRQAADATVALTATLVDDMQLEIDRLVDTLRQQGASEADIQLITKPLEQAKRLQAALEKLRTEFPLLSTAVQTGLGTLDDLEFEDPFDLSGVARDADQATRAAIDLGRQIDQAARGAIQLAEAFGLVDERSAQALATMVQIGAALPGILAGDPASILSGIGGIAKLSSGLGKDPAAVQRQKEHEENIRALRAIEKHTGDLLTVRASGRELTSIGSGLDKVLGSSIVKFIESAQSGRRQQTEQAAAAGTFAKTGQGLDELSLTTGLSIERLKAIAASMNITLNGSVESLRAFQQQLLKADLAAFGEGFAGQIRKLEIAARLDPQAFEGIAGILKRLQILAGPDGAGAITKALEGIDVSTVEGRAAAIAALTKVLENVGSLDVADLGGLELSEFIEEILGSVERLRALDPTPLQKFADALGLLRERFEVEGTSAADRVKGLVALFAATFEEFEGLGEGTSVEDVRTRFKAAFDAAAADGTIDEGERAILDAFTALLAAMQSEVLSAQERAEANLSASEDIEVRKLKAEGRTEEAEALERQRQQEAELAALRLKGVDEAIIAQLALVQALENAALAAAKAARAEQDRADFLNGLAVAQLEAAGDTLGAELLRIKHKFDAQRKTARGLFTGDELTDILAQIAALEAAELQLAASRAATAAAPPLRPPPKEDPTPAEPATPNAREAEALSNVQTLTERSGSILIDLQRQQVFYLREIRDMMRSVGPVPALVAPNISGLRAAPGGLGSGGPVMVRLAFDFNINDGAQSGSALVRQLRAALPELSGDLGRLLTQELDRAARSRGQMRVTS